MEKDKQSPKSEMEEKESVPGMELAIVAVAGDDGAGNSNNVVSICEVCNKEFNSKKALGGHMRVHTQVLKSSKKPPTPLKIQEPMICKVCDRRFLSQRSLWGHMRCHPNKALKPDAERKTDEEDDIYAAVYALLLLATGDERYRVRSMEEEEEERNLRKRKREVNGEFECEVCWKCFKSYQALGGHRSSAHTKKIQAIMSLEMVEKVGHVCKICDKEFDSGQALGGHQRCHWRGSYGASSSSAAAEHGGERGGEHGGEGGGGGLPSDEGKTVVFDFDLNELPPEEDEDGDQPAEV